MADPSVRELPLGFDERGGDWQTVREEDQFTRLYLDPTCPELITPQRTKLHYELLSAFWAGKIKSLNQGAGRDAIIAKYGGKELSEAAIRRYPQRLREAWEALQDAPRIAAALRRLDDERRDRGLSVIRQSMDDMIADHAFVTAESKRLFNRGAEAGLRDDEIADFVANILKNEEFIAAGTPRGKTLAEQVQSCDWHRRGYAIPSRSVVMPLKIGGHRAHSVTELIEACDAEPDAAQHCLFAGYIATWLVGTLGETGLAEEANVAIKDRSHERNALELFVRDLCRDEGLPAEPDYRLPAILDFGTVPVGAERKLQLRLQSANPRRGWGTCTLIPAVPGLGVNSRFSITDDSIDVSLTTLGTEPGSYSTELLIQVDGGTARAISVRFQVASATLRVVPQVIDFGTIDFDRTYETDLVIDTVEGDATLTASYSTDGPGSALSATGASLGHTCAAQVRLATGQLRAGTSGAGLVRVVTNVGNVDVPVKYSIRLNKAQPVRWAIGAALAGAIGLGAVREIIADTNYHLAGWLPGITTSGSIFVTGFEAGLCGLLVLIIGMKIGKRG